MQESEDLQGPDQRLAQIIQDHSKRMNLVIENVLQLSRRRQAEPQLLDLKYWLHRFASEFRSSAPADRQLHLETQGGSLQTRMDPHQLNQVLTNLVQNGLRYSAQKHRLGQVWLRLFRDAESDLPVLQILDDGPGVPVDQRARIIRRGERLDAQHPGQGIGLAVVKDILDSYGGELSLGESPLGGAAFQVRLRAD